MNKAELIQQLEVRLGSKKAAAEALNAVVDIIERQVSKGEKVSITGFGTFEKITRAARKGRNPRTGESVRIKRTSVPKFRPGATFKGYVANPKSMPKVVRATKATAATKPTVAKTAAKAAVATKAAAKKTVAKKTVAKKTVAKAAPAKKAAAVKKTTAAKKAATKKTATRRSAK